MQIFVIMGMQGITGNVLGEDMISTPRDKEWKQNILTDTIFT